jgi:hypothetical protein
MGGRDVYEVAFWAEFVEGRATGLQVLEKGAGETPGLSGRVAVSGGSRGRGSILRPEAPDRANRARTAGSV